MECHCCWCYQWLHKVDANILADTSKTRWLFHDRIDHIVFRKHRRICKSLLIFFHFLILWLSIKKINQNKMRDSAKYQCVTVQEFNMKTPLPYYLSCQSLIVHFLCLPGAPLLLIPLPLALILHRLSKMQVYTWWSLFFNLKTPAFWELKSSRVW